MASFPVRESVTVGIENIICFNKNSFRNEMYIYQNKHKSMLR
jgi:hypothetical protein